MDTASSNPLLSWWHFVLLLFINFRLPYTSIGSFLSLIFNSIYCIINNIFSHRLLPWHVLINIIIFLFRLRCKIVNRLPLIIRGLSHNYLTISRWRVLQFLFNFIPHHFFNLLWVCWCLLWMQLAPSHWIVNTPPLFHMRNFLYFI